LQKWTRHLIESDGVADVLAFLALYQEVCRADGERYFEHGYADYEDDFHRRLFVGSRRGGQAVESRPASDDGLLLGLELIDEGFADLGALLFAFDARGGEKFGDDFLEPKDCFDEIVAIFQEIDGRGGDRGFVHQELLPEFVALVDVTLYRGAAARFWILDFGFSIFRRQIAGVV
jgi:hypothetical protein